MRARRLRAVLVRLGGLFGREGRDREMAEELESHLQMQIDDNLRAGMSQREARRLALVKLGGTAQAIEECRRRRGFPLIEDLRQDLRYARRILFKSPAFTMVSVLSLALGIGVNATVFGFVNSLMFRPLPLPDNERLVRIQDDNLPAYSDYLAFREHTDAFDGLAAYDFDSFNLFEGESSGRAGVAAVSGNYFDVLKVKPALGRTFSPDEDDRPGAAPVAVISHGLWQRRFGADPNVIGKTFRLQRVPFMVIGVAPQEFKGITLGWQHDLWIPFATELLLRPDSNRLKSPDSYQVRVIGRLKSDASPAQAQAALDVVAAQQDRIPKVRLFTDNPGEQPPTPRALMPATVLEMGPSERRQAWLGVAGILTVMGLVLLVACANVANLLLGRAAGRRQEIAVRLALGAGRGRIVRQLLTESILLSLLGGAAGLLLSRWAGDILLSVMSRQSTEAAVTLDLSFDWRTLLFTLLLSAATGVAFGLAPALQISKPDLVADLKAETTPHASGRRRFNFRNALVVTQVAVSTLLLIPAVLLIRNIQLARSSDYGFPTADRYVTAVDLGGLGYDESRQKMLREELLDKVRATPGVRSATLSQIVPLSGGMMVIPLEVEGETTGAQATDVFTKNDQSMYALDQPGSLYLNTVDMGYFETAGIPLVAGRDFSERDDSSAPDVIVVNETLARRLAPNGQAVGRRLFERDPLSQKTRYMEVVGVARDVKYIWPSERPRYFAYRPLRQREAATTFLTVHASGDLKAISESLRSAAKSVDPSLPVEGLTRLDEIIDRRLGESKIIIWVSGAVGALALLLASIGLYGVMAYAVAARTKEIGIRVALGAGPGRVSRMILADGLALAAVGTLVGLMISAACMRLMGSLLYGVSPTDPITYAGVSLFLTGVALLACYVPARRATKVDPIIALRYE
jgi:predicted permease